MFDNFSTLVQYIALMEFWQGSILESEMSMFTLYTKWNFVFRWCSFAIPLAVSNLAHQNNQSAESENQNILGVEHQLEYIASREANFLRLS